MNEVITETTRARAQAPEIPLLRIQQFTGLPSLAFALLCAVLVFLFMVAPTTIMPPDRDSLTEIIASGLFFALSIAIIAGFTRPVFHGAVKDLQSLNEVLPISSEDLALLSRAIPRFRSTVLGRLTVLAVISGLGHSYLLGAFRLPFPYAAAQYLGTQLIWLLMFWTVPILIANAQLFSSLGRVAKPDLLRPSKHAAFGSAALRPALFLIGMLCAYPLLLISADDLGDAVLIGVFASLIPLIGIVVLPLRGIRQRIRERRETTLTAIDARLDRSLHADIVNGSAEELFELDAVLDMRERIAQAPGWPLDVAAIKRILLYVILPPLTWAAAAVVEMFVDGVL